MISEHTETSESHLDKFFYRTSTTPLTPKSTVSGAKSKKSPCEINQAEDNVGANEEVDVDELKKRKR
jgi:hypothetical protein